MKRVGVLLILVPLLTSCNVAAMSPKSIDSNVIFQYTNDYSYKEAVDYTKEQAEHYQEVSAEVAKILESLPKVDKEETKTQTSDAMSPVNIPDVKGYVVDLSKIGIDTKKLGSYTDYVQKYIGFAFYGYKTYNIFPSVSLAIGMKESSGGKSCTNTNNMFGLMTDKEVPPPGRYYIGTKPTPHGQLARVYARPEDSYIDFIDTIGTHSTYKRAIQCKDAEPQLRYIVGPFYYGNDDQYIAEALAFMRNELYKIDDYVKKL